MIEKKDYPILEFDSNKQSVIEPHKVIAPADIPDCCVITFFRDVIEAMSAEGKLFQIASLKSETVTIPIYETTCTGKKICLAQGFVGAPGAAANLEEMIALGIKKFIVCGGAGVLRKDIAAGHLILPNAAVRDEGTSYHYAAPSREMKADEYALKVIEAELKKRGISYIDGKTWTNDAFYRETKDKVAKRLEEGCLCVEMEASAFMAVAQFRGVTLGQILYGGDDVSGDEWDSRKWQSRGDIRRSLTELSMEICLKL